MALFISLINIIKDFEDERECAGAPGLQAPHDPVSGEVRDSGKIEILER
jgi:hypothetical protein